LGRSEIYRSGFDKVFRDAGIKVKKNSVRAPNLQAVESKYCAELKTQ
jgi:hypothetical protein